LWQRIFGVGTVTIASSDKSMPMLHLKNVKSPLMVKELIHQLVEDTKAKRRMRVGEILVDEADDNADFDIDD
jgi:hypothetical protein